MNRSARRLRVLADRLSGTGLLLGIFFPIVGRTFGLLAGLGEDFGYG